LAGSTNIFIGLISSEERSIAAHLPVDKPFKGQKKKKKKKNK